MLQMHDNMKEDEDYQKNGQQWAIDFPPGSTWVCYADLIPHAAMGGQFMLEQTNSLEIEDMKTPENSPLRILERLTGEVLV